MAPGRLSVGETIGEIAGPNRFDDDFKKRWFDEPSFSPFYSGIGITIYHGQALNVVRSLPDESVQLVLTSPPYNIGKPYERRTTLKEYLDEQKPVLEQLVRVLRPTGSLCWQVGNFVADGEVFPLDNLYYPLFKAHGLKLRNRVVWRFGHGLHCRHRLSGRYETLSWFTKGEDYVFNLDAVRVPSKYPNKRHFKGPHKGELSGNPFGKNPSDVWELMAAEWDDGWWDFPNVKSNHPEKTSHPCQFPVELAERCVLAFSNEGDTVIDPYAGAGTSLVAGRKHGRHVIGIDLETSYLDIAESRLRALAAGTLPMRQLGRSIHEPAA